MCPWGPWAVALAIQPSDAMAIVAIEGGPIEVARVDVGALVETHVVGFEAALAGVPIDVALDRGREPGLEQLRVGGLDPLVLPTHDQDHPGLGEHRVEQRGVVGQVRVVLDRPADDRLGADQHGLVLDPIEPGMDRRAMLLEIDAGRVAKEDLEHEALDRSVARLRVVQGMHERDPG